MKTTGKFEISFYGQGNVEEDNNSSSTYTVDGKSMFRKDSGGKDCFDRAGYVELGELGAGKIFSLTIPSGQLAGRILEIRLEDRDLRTERGLMGMGTFPVTTLVIEGSWKGAKNGLLNGDSACASFRPLDGSIREEWVRRAKAFAASNVESAKIAYGDNIPEGVQAANTVALNATEVL